MFSTLPTIATPDVPFLNEPQIVGHSDDHHVVHVAIIDVLQLDRGGVRVHPHVLHHNSRRPRMIETTKLSTASSSIDSGSTLRQASSLANQRSACSWTSANSTSPFLI